MKTIVEPARELPIIEDVDVVVAGGGPGGVPAAVAAARRGCKVLLVERYGFLGGMATGGLMGPLFGYAWARGPLLLGGIPVEMVHRLQALNAAPTDKAIAWPAIRFDPESLKHVCDDIVSDAGVKLLLHAWVVDVVRQGDRIEAVIIESKSGRQAITAKRFIDATGDGDIAAAAGCEYTKGRRADGRTQPMGTKFKIGGVDMPKATAALKESRDLVNRAIDEKRIPAYHAFWGEVSEQGITLRDTEVTPTVTRCPGDATNVYDLTRAEVQIRRDTLAIVDFYRRNVPGYENCYLMETPACVGIRETRQILGDTVLTGNECLQSIKHPESTIARGCWFVDIHCPLGWWSSKSNLCDQKCKTQPDCLMKREHWNELYDSMFPYKTGKDDANAWYDIPYGCIVPRRIENLLVSGRCISADPGGMASARVIGTCFAIGEAAGAAAALSLQAGVRPRELPIERLQADLRKAGVPLG